MCLDVVPLVELLRLARLFARSWTHARLTNRQVKLTKHDLKGGSSSGILEAPCSQARAEDERLSLVFMTEAELR